MIWQWSDFFVGAVKLKRGKDMGIGNERGIELFRRAGALLKGHFRLQSGMDSLHYVAKDLLRENDDEAMREICRGIAEDFVTFAIDTVVGPESGAVKYAEYVAEYLSGMTGKKVVAVRARKKAGELKMFHIASEDLQYIKNKRVLVVEDVFTTGESARKVVDLVCFCDGIVAGVGGVWNRGGVTAKDLGVNFLICQINESFPSYEPGKESCPGCEQEIPYDLKWGHGKTLIGEHYLAKTQ